MIIYFIETESGEEQFFREMLSGSHDLRFVEYLTEIGPDAEGLSTFIYSKIDAPFLDAHPNLKFVSTRSTGYDHIDLSSCAAKGVKVCTVPSYGDNTVAEHTFALLLALSRRLRESMQANKGAQFSYEGLRGFELKGKTLGVIGSGRIGLHAIRIAKAFGMEVLAYDLSPQSFMTEIMDFHYVTFDELLSRSDVISLHIPLFPATYHLLNREAFAKCKRGVIILNTARGPLIDTDALIEALESGIVLGAGLDVLEEESVFQKETMDIIGDQIMSKLQSTPPPSELRTSNPERIVELQRLIRNSELIDRPNVVFTPHVAFNSVEAVQRINTVTWKNIEGFANGMPVNVVSPN